MIKGKIAILNSLYKFLISFILVKMFFRGLYKKNIWLIGEKKTEARDNGYHLFKYIRKNHKDINIYYLITKNSADRDKVIALGNVINFGSLKHYIYFICADYLINSQQNGCVPSEVFLNKFFKKLRNKEQKNIFLQHGITKDRFESLLNHNEFPCDLFISGAKPEYEYIKSTFSYPQDNIALTGFCRFDELHCDKNTENQILIMPTWRRWLKFGDSTKKAKIQEFTQSLYFNAYADLLSNKDFLSKAAYHGYKIVFYPHYVIQNFIGAFIEKIPDKYQDVVTIADRWHYDVQDLLKKSALLITDYSSVFFDFAYMKKPIIYYQFDEEQYRSNHYAEGYFDYRDNGFGQVLTNEDDLVATVIEYLDSYMQIPELYKKRMDEFFIPYDDNNCKRVYEAITKIK